MRNHVWTMFAVAALLPACADDSAPKSSRPVLSLLSETRGPGTFDNADLSGKIQLDGTTAWISGTTRFHQCDGAGVQAVNIGNPSRPELVQLFDGHYDFLLHRFDTSRYRGSVLISSTGGPCIFTNPPGTHEIRDVTAPGFPSLLKSLPFTPPYADGGVPRYVEARQDRVFAWYTRREITPSDVALVVYEISDPAAPARIGDFGVQRDLHLAPPAGYWSFSDFSVDPDGRVALASTIDGSFELEVSDPAHPRLLGRLPAWIAARFDGPSRIVAIQGGDVVLYEHTTLANELARLRPRGSDPRAWVSFTIDGTLLFAAWYGEGIRVYDVRDFAHPVELSSYPVGPSSFFGRQEAFSPVNLAVSGSLLLVTESRRGLMVFEVNDPR